MIIGITGGSGSGKSTVSALFREHGWFVIDADEVAHTVMGKGSACLAEVCEAFGKDVLQKDGELDRKKLGAIVFADSKKRKRLNEITLHYIVQAIKEQLCGKTDRGAYKSSKIYLRFRSVGGIYMGNRFEAAAAERQASQQEIINPKKETKTSAPKAKEKKPEAKPKLSKKMEDNQAAVMFYLPEDVKLKLDIYAKENKKAVAEILRELVVEKLYS